MKKIVSQYFFATAQGDIYVFETETWACKMPVNYWQCV